MNDTNHKNVTLITKSNTINLTCGIQKCNTNHKK